MKFLIFLLIFCFVKDTPVLMASNPFRTNAAAYALAAMPIAVPIQDVQLLDYAVAHKSVNSTYGLTASTNEPDSYQGLLGLMDKDPYTSDQQRERDEYEINDTDWYEVAFEELNGSSSCKLALHNDWITNHSYVVDGIVNMNLPEQGISGLFKITSIKHIIPQKKPVDEDENDEWEFRPVTGLFTHQSNDVWKITFDNGTALGVTNNHPIYSLSKGDWQHAGHLEIGEEVLALYGNVKVVSKERDLTIQPVYNLEVKDLHNFLVGDVGVVVHNTGLCDNVVRDWINKKFPKIGTKNIKAPGTKHAIKDDKVKQKYGKTEICYDDLGFPDFSPFVEKFTDQITGQLKEAAFEINMSGNYSSDYTQANAALRAMTGDSSMPDFPRTINGIEFTWHHHQDGKTMMLVPKAVNNPDFGGAPHVGGVALKNNGMTGDDSILPTYKDSKGQYLSKCN